MQGGGINLYENAVVNIHTSKLINNVGSKFHGGIRVGIGSTLNVVDSEISHNKATENDCGGVGIKEGTRVKFSNTTITSNTAKRSLVQI